MARGERSENNPNRQVGSARWNLSVTDVKEPLFGGSREPEARRQAREQTQAADAEARKKT